MVCQVKTIATGSQITTNLFYLSLPRGPTMAFFKGPVRAIWITEPQKLVFEAPCLDKWHLKDSQLAKISKIFFYC